jgi:hypothetical protein
LVVISGLVLLACLEGYFNSCHEVIACLAHCSWNLREAEEEKVTQREREREREQVRETKMELVRTKTGFSFPTLVMLIEVMQWV